MTRGAPLPHRTARALTSLPGVAVLAAIALAYVAVTLWLGRQL